MLRDQLLHGVGPESLSVLAGMLSGMSQKEIAADLGVSASAVSQRVRRDGLAALVRADDLLGRLQGAGSRCCSSGSEWPISATP